MTVPMCNCGQTCKQARPTPLVSLTFSRKARRILLGYAFQPSVKTSKGRKQAAQRRTCWITPSSYRPFIQAKGMHNGLDRTSIGQQGHDQHDELLRFAQALEHRSPASAERFFARFAAIALPAAIMDDNRARISLASCRTHRVRAKYLRWVHWLECTFLHKHILPGTLAFFNSPPLHRLVGSYRSTRHSLHKNWRYRSRRITRAR